MAAGGAASNAVSGFSCQRLHLHSMGWGSRCWLSAMPGFQPFFFFFFFFLGGSNAGCQSQPAAPQVEIRAEALAVHGGWDTGPAVAQQCWMRLHVWACSRVVR